MGDHFQDSKFKILLKDPGLSLVSFYAAGPFENFTPLFVLKLHTFIFFMKFQLEN